MLLVIAKLGEMLVLYTLLSRDIIYVIPATSSGSCSLIRGNAHAFVLVLDATLRHSSMYRYRFQRPVRPRVAFIRFSCGPVL